MSRFLLNGFREVKSRWNQLSDKIYEIKFGLTLISKSRYNYYFRVFMLSSAAVTTGAYFSFHSLPPAMNGWTQAIHKYESGDKQVMDEELRRFAETVWSECNRTLNKSSDVIHFFYVIGSEVISVGSLGLPNGAKIGLPFSFSYKTIEDVKTTDIRFLGEHNPHAKWRSDSGQAFLKSVVLSENAKKFAIARQIYTANNTTLLMDSLNVGLSTIVGLGLAQTFINSRKSPVWRSWPTQVTVRLVSLCFGFYIWCQINKINNYLTSLSADKKAISLGEDYLNGGIEYYSKVKTRNATFVDLMDQSMRFYRPFTEEGENRGISRLLTIERRINYLKQLKDRLKDLNQNESIEEKS